jgi:hypothetical protein
MRKVVVLFLSAILIPSLSYGEPAKRPGSTVEAPKPASRPATRPNSTSVTKPATRPNAQPSAPAPVVKVPKANFDKPAALEQSKEESRKLFTAPAPKPYTPPVVRTPTPTTTPARRPNVTVSTPAVRPNAPSTSYQPPTVIIPNVTFDRPAAQDQAREESRREYAPPREYIPPKPQPRTRTASVSQEQYDSRQQRIEQHYRNYNTYNSLPQINVGGGFSTLFWYSTLEWEAQRRALFMYNNQYNIDRNLYEQELAKNAALRAEIDRLAAAKTPIDPNYVDAEYVGKEDLMLANDKVYPPTDFTILWNILLTLLVIGIVCLLIYLIFIKKWNA